MTASFVYCVNELERTAHVSNQIRFFCLQVRVSCINGMLKGSVFLSLEMYLVRMSIQHWGKEMSMKKGRDRVTTAVVSWLMHRYHILAYHRKNEDGALKRSRRELTVNNRQHLANLQGDGQGRQMVETTRRSGMLESLSYVHIFSSFYNSILYSGYSWSRARIEVPSNQQPPKE